MLKNEREQEILATLRESGYVTVKHLSERLFTSESSIRRTLSALEAKGAVKRSYGGVELLENHTNIISFGIRTHHNAAAKQEIAKKAAPLVPNGSIIFLDQSSTAFYLAAALIEKKGLTVVTNNIEILSLLSQTNFTVYSSGGCLSESNRVCLIGTDAQKTFGDIYAQFAFFSTKAVSADGIATDCNKEEVAVRQTMLQHAQKRVFLCDSGKYGTVSGYRQCTLSDVDIMISEKDHAACFQAQFPGLSVL